MATIEAAKQTISIHWSAELDEVATRVAAREGKSKDEFLRRLLLDALEDAEDYWIAEDAMAEFRRSGEKSKTLDEVSRELGLDD